MERKISGDAENGWIVELHDGDRYSSHVSTAATEQEAVAEALARHEGLVTPAPDHDARIERLEAQIAELERLVGLLVATQPQGFGNEPTGDPAASPLPAAKPRRDKAAKQQVEQQAEQADTAAGE